MRKVGLYILWVILLILFLLGMIKIMGGCNQNTTCAKKEILVVNVPVAVPQQQTARSVVPSSSKTRIAEKEIRTGNKGYFILEKEYVYFGISKTVREVLLAK